MKCMAQTNKCMDQIAPKTAKSGPKSFPFREDPCLVSKHPPFYPFRVIFSMHDDWLIHFLDFSTIKHHIWFSKEYKNTQLAFKWNTLWLNIEEMSFEFMCHLVHACLHSCVPVCVLTRQNSCYFWWLPLIMQSVWVNVIIYTERVKDHSSDLGWRHSRTASHHWKGNSLSGTRSECVCDRKRGVSKPKTSGTLIRSTIEKALANEGPLRHTLLRMGNSTVALPQRGWRLLSNPGSPIAADRRFLWT